MTKTQAKQLNRAVRSWFKLHYFSHKKLREASPTGRVPFSDGTLRNALKANGAVKEEQAKNILRAWNRAYVKDRNASKTEEELERGYSKSIQSPESVPQLPGSGASRFELTGANFTPELVGCIHTLRNQLIDLKERNNTAWRTYGLDPAHNLPEIAVWDLASAPDLTRERQMLDQLATMYEWIGNWAEARKILEDFARLQRLLGDPIYEARARLRLAWALYESGDYREAIKTAQLARRLLVKIKNVEIPNPDMRILARLYDVEGLANLRLGKSDGKHIRTACDLLKKSLPLREAIGGGIGVATTLIRLGLVYMDLQDRKMAEKTLERARNVALAHGSLAVASRALYDLGVMHLRENSWLKAYDTLCQCRMAQENCKDVAGLAKTHQLLAVLTYHLALQLPAELRPDNGSFAKDLPCVPKCLWEQRDCAVLLDRDWSALEVHHKFEVIHRWLWDMAIHHLTKCAEFSRDRCRPEVYASAQIGLGWTRLERGETDAAHRHLQEAEGHVEEHKDAHECVAPKIEEFKRALKIAPQKTGEAQDDSLNGNGVSMSVK